MPSNRYIVTVEAAIFRDGRYVLVERGPEEDYLPGVLTLPGGKAEEPIGTQDILEKTLHREVLEEVGLYIHPEVEYLESKSFMMDDDPVCDVVFLCRYKSGSAAAKDSGEVAAIAWLTPDEIIAHPSIPSWVRRSIGLAERKRKALGW